MRGCGFIVSLVAATLMWSGLPTAAQVDPGNDPNLTDPSLDDVTRRLTGETNRADPVPRVAAPSVRPVEPGSGGAATLTPDNRGMLPEASFIPPSTATAIRSGVGEWILVFHPDSAGTKLAPMILLPAPAMARLEELAKEAGPETNPVVVVSGQVFLYQGRMHLLPTVIARVTASDPVREAPPSETGDAPAIPAVLEDDPSVKALIRDLESARSRQRALEALPAMTSEGEDGSELAPIDTFLLRQSGRVVRDAGVWTFHPDNDVESLSGRPLVLMPCQNLARIQQLASSQGSSIKFIMSGRVLSYKGVAFLIPTLYQVARDSGVTPLQ